MEKLPYEHGMKITPPSRDLVNSPLKRVTVKINKK